MAIRCSLFLLAPVIGFVAAAYPQQTTDGPAGIPHPKGERIRPGSLDQRYAGTGHPSRIGRRAQYAGPEQGLAHSAAVGARDRECCENTIATGPLCRQIGERAKIRWLLAASIAYAGNQEALRQVGKLLAVDSKRFDDLVGVTLTHARSFRNPYGVAYQGFEIGNSAIDSRIAAWAESDLADKVGGASSRQWAEAMVDKYGGVPSENEWRTDPIASRLSPALAESLHDNIIRLAAELVARRAKQ